MRLLHLDEEELAEVPRCWNGKTSTPDGNHGGWKLPPSGDGANGSQIPTEILMVGAIFSVLATERAGFAQRMRRLEVWCGDQCRENVEVWYRARRAPGDNAERRHAGTLDQCHEITSIMTDFARVDARYFEVEFRSEAAGTHTDAATWEIDAMVLKADRTDYAPK